MGTPSLGIVLRLVLIVTLVHYGPVAQETSTTLEEMIETVKNLKSIVGVLGNQIMLQQLFAEERIRNEAGSGIKQTRMDIGGTRPYSVPTHVRDSVAAFHDHANYDRTVGIGEMIAILNGVEFRTRHNDYKLVMPCTNNASWHCTENIPFPDVPPEVANKNTVQEQIAEMKEWFKAWRDQNYFIRDYRPYFKPVLCYLEGAWTTVNPDGKLEESFESDRHALDATDWADLHSKTRFTSYAGRKSQLENFAFLPVTVMNITEDGFPEMAQWNYRILCHPLSKDLSTSNFRVLDDVASRMAYQSDYKQHSETRRARFQINPENTKFWQEEHHFLRSHLDELMEEIPGKNNYPGYLEDNVFDEGFYHIDSLPNGTDVMLNAARYHRWYKVVTPGASGLHTRHRSFSDPNVFMSMTDQDKVVGLTYKKCTNRGKVCQWAHQKWTYAIPLEIIYLTPLSLWNPYDIEHKGARNSDFGKTVFHGENGIVRNGGKTVEKAYNGTNDATYFLTPNEFFGSITGGAADTTRKGVGVLDKSGTVRVVSSTGIRVLINIPDVGIVRQRWPIYPLATDGNSVQKDVEALKDMVMEQARYLKMYRDPPKAGEAPSTDTGPDLLLVTSTTTQDPPGEHFHEVVLTANEQKRLEDGEMFTVYTTVAQSHSHELRLRYDKYCMCYEIMRCDREESCWDGHDMELFEEIPTTA